MCLRASSATIDFLAPVAEFIANRANGIPHVCSKRRHQETPLKRDQPWTTRFTRTMYVPKQRSALPSLMPSSVSSVKSSPYCSTRDLAVHVTLPGSAR